jgi:hypothetical protein
LRTVACLAALTLTLSAAAIGTATAAQHTPASLKPYSETTVSKNLLRNGWDASEPALSPAVVGGGKFHQLFATKVNGQVYAQPLVIDNPATASSDLIVATQDDWVYRLDGTTGQVAQSAQLGTPWSFTVPACNLIDPNIGDTSTPVYDPATGTVYLIAVVTHGNPTVSTPTIEFFALDEQTLAVKWSRAISGAAANDPKQAFNPKWELQRTGLLLMNGWVYAGFGSYCDHGTYEGFISGVDVANQGKSATLWTDEARSPDANPQGGIWQGGGGLMSDGPGRIFFASGNGTSPPRSPGGSKTPAQLGDSVVRLAVAANGSLAAGDFFSPANAPSLNGADRDLGSGAPVGLPFGTRTFPHLLVQAGKDGRVFLLNRDSLGGRQQGPGSGDKVVGMSGPFGGEWGHPAAFAGSGGNDYVYYTGKNDFLRALKFNGSNPAHPTLTAVGHSAGTFGYGSGSPAVTSSGTDPRSAVVWEVNTPDAKNAQLQAYNAIPSHGTLKEIWSAPIGRPGKFTVVATDNDRVYVGVEDDGTRMDRSHGIVRGFGVSNQAPLLAPQVSFGSVSLSSGGKTLTATITATEALQVTGITAPSAPFTTGAASAAGVPVAVFPVSLRAHQQLTIPVTFTPTAVGAVIGSITIATNVPGFAQVSVPLAGTGTAP